MPKSWPYPANLTPSGRQGDLDMYRATVYLDILGKDSPTTWFFKRPASGRVASVLDLARIEISVSTTVQGYGDITFATTLTPAVPLGKHSLECLPVPAEKLAAGCGGDGGGTACACQFPFSFNGRSYDKCTTSVDHPEPWCASKVDGE